MSPTAEDKSLVEIAITSRCLLMLFKQKNLLIEKVNKIK